MIGLPYKLHLLQHLKDTDKSTREDFCTQMQVMLEEDGFDDRLVFSDEATFHVTGKVNKHNTRIWRTEHPHAVVEHVRDSPKVNVFCAMSKKCVYGSGVARCASGGAGLGGATAHFLQSF